MCTPSRTAPCFTRSLSSEAILRISITYQIHLSLSRYTGFKEVIKVVALPDKPSVVALIDVDKVLGKSFFCPSQVFLNQGNLMDILQQKFLKSIPFWDGTCSKDGRYGLYAPATGGMEMLDLRTGKVCRTLIPKVKSRHYAVLFGFEQVAEGIFDVLAVFNETNEFVLYYHRFCLEAKTI